MRFDLVALAGLMALVTYPSRSLPLLAPGLERLPARVFVYLRLVGPAALGALAATNTAIVSDAARRPSLHVGIEWLAVAACLAVVAWRRNLFLGLCLAVALAAGGRALGLA